MHAKTRAFVLKKKKLPGQDFIITLFSSDFGKTTVYAKGIKKLTSRRNPHIQTGNLLDVILHQRGNGHYLQETSLVSAFSSVKENAHKLHYQYLLFYLIDRLLPEAQKEEAIFTLLQKFFIELSGSDEFNMTHMEHYANKILYKLGYTKEAKSFSELSELFLDLTHEPLPRFAFE